jgi:uncharacterized alpha-E superfamily protein
VNFNATALRDRLSDDTWRLLNKMVRQVNTRNVRSRVPEALEFLNSLVLQLAAFTGMEMENMTRGHGWRFLDLGRRVERAQNILTLLKAAVHPPPRNDSVLGPVLEVFDSAMSYRRRYHARAQLAPVLDMLIADETNPRSLTWQLHQLTRHASQLPRTGREGDGHEEKRQVDGMLSELAGVNFETLVKYEDANPGTLVALFDELFASLGRLSQTISVHYFSHALPHVR